MSGYISKFLLEFGTFHAYIVVIDVLDFLAELDYEETLESHY